MATTYTYQNAYDTAVAFSRNITITSANQIRLADVVNSEIWGFAPWRWAKSNLTAISLVDGTQDYTVADSDFAILTKCWLRRTDTDPDQYQMLDIVDFLPAQLNIEQTFRGHRSVAYVKTGGNDRLRLEYAASIPSGVTVQIEGEYKQNPTKITALSDSVPFDDRYFHVVVNGLTYWIYRFDNDPRAGAMTVTRGGNRAYTGAWGTYVNSMWAMAEQEDAYQQTNFPDEGWGSTGANAPWLFL